jgi:hypothetical protein
LNEDLTGYNCYTFRRGAPLSKPIRESAARKINAGNSKKEAIMQAAHSWMWANLTHEQLDLLTEAEQTLGTDVLIAFQAGNQPVVQDSALLTGGLQVADLNESQLECLQGLEQKLSSVVVAYQTDS